MHSSDPLPHHPLYSYQQLPVYTRVEIVVTISVELLELFYTSLCYYVVNIIKRLSYNFVYFS